MQPDKINSSKPIAWSFNKLNEDERKVELYLYGELTNEDWGFNDNTVSVNAVQKILQEAKGKELILHINSVGGSSIAGYAIYSLLKQHDKKIITIIDGVCFSAATMIALAGDTVKISPAGLFMIHNHMVNTQGDSEYLRKTADDLDKIASVSQEIYAKKTGKSVDEIKQLMNAETYFTATEAVDAGFCDEILGDISKIAQLETVNNQLFIGGVNITNFKNKFPNNFFNGVKNMPEPINQATNLVAFSLSELKQQHPDVYNQAIAEERKRLQEIEEIAVAGYENLVNLAKYEGMSAGEFAIALAKAQKDQQKNQVQNYLNQVNDSGVNNVNAMAIPSSVANNVENSTEDKELATYRSVAQRFFNKGE
jgi:ATP-dependent protease ClpP protease subunit